MRDAAPRHPALARGQRLRLTLPRRYAPLHTDQLLTRRTGETLAAIEESDGAAGVALAEAMVLEEVSAMARCCVSTIGGGVCWRSLRGRFHAGRDNAHLPTAIGKGAAARGQCWRHLYGGVTVWLGAHQRERLKLQRSHARS